MNPWGLDATGLMVWGLVAHLIADWPLQNDWMARNKAYLRHPAGYVHAGIHGALLALVFGWVAAPLAAAHLLVDTRVPVARWSRLVQQTQPRALDDVVGQSDTHGTTHYGNVTLIPQMVDVGTEVRFLDRSGVPHRVHRGRRVGGRMTDFRSAALCQQSASGGSVPSGRRRRGREPWSERTIRAAYDDPRPLMLAFADPPYPHQSERHYGDHQDYAGEVDHGALVARLTDEFDGWALCTGAYMACDVMRLCPKGTRQLIWRKPSASYKPGVSISFQYEPVFIYAGRRRHRHAMMLPDVFAAPVVYGEHNGIRRGVKSQLFCTHVFEALGARPELGDTLIDAFPGSGAVTDAWTAWQAAPRLPIFAPEAA